MTETEKTPHSVDISEAVRIAAETAASAASGVLSSLLMRVRGFDFDPSKNPIQISFSNEVTGATITGDSTGYNFEVEENDGASILIDQFGEMTRYDAEGNIIEETTNESPIEGDTEVE